MEEDLEKGKDHSIIIAALIFIILTAVFTIVVYKQINFGKFNISILSCGIRNVFFCHLPGNRRKGRRMDRFFGMDS